MERHQTTLDWLDIESPVPLNQWTGTAGEMRAIADGLGLAPWSGSPLLDAVPPEPVRASTPPATPGLVDAWQVLAQPEVRLDVAHVPPLSGATSRFYGRCGRQSLVGHWLDAGTHHVAWPIEPVGLTRLVASLVETGRPAHEIGVSLDVDRPGYEVLAALVDLLQEASLVALLEGRDVDEPQVDGRGLADVFARPRSVHDLRWMVARARSMAPGPLAPDEARLSTALARLARDRWLAERASRYVVTPTLRLVCSLLADTRGWCAVSRRVRQLTDDGGIEWSRQHAAVLRGLDSLWMLGFADIATDGFTVRLRDTTTEDATERIGAWCAPAPVADRAPTARKAAVAPPPPLPLDEVGTVDPAGEWYCAIDRETRGPMTPAEIHALVSRATVTASTLVWNASMDQWVSAEAAGLVTLPDLPTGAAASLRFCPACGTPWRPGAGFCASCGARGRHLSD